MKIRFAIPLLSTTLMAASGGAAGLESAPIAAVVPQLDRLQKWDDMQGDTADPFWADDDNLYHFTCDGRGFGRLQRNLSFNKLVGADAEHLVGTPVNSMDEYGKAGAVEADGATWKVTGQECVDGVFYAFVVRNIYGDKSHDPLLRQTSFNASLIKSHDRGKTWTRSAAENLAAPMWPGERFGAPCFIHYGRDGGHVSRDNADRYVYAISNNGFWNGGDDYILGRIPRTDLPNLRAADWTYYRGGDGLADVAWTGELSQAKAILDRPGKLGWTAPVFVPALNRYLLAAWHVTPTLMKWFEPGRVVYEFFEAPHPWGPWTFVSSFDDGFLAPGQHMYGPNLCAKFQQTAGDDVLVDLYTSGCPFEDVRTGLYKNWRIPLILKTRPPPAVVVVNDDDPAIRYVGAWKAGAGRGCNDHNDDIHYSNTPGDAAEYSFTGSGIALLSEKYPDQGSLEVRLDDRPAVAVNLKQENFPRLVRIPVFSAQGLPAGPHTLRLVNTGSGYAALDAFVVSTGPDGRAAPGETAEKVPPLPTPAQVRWQELEFYGFLHFTVNTFSGKEWGFGNEPEALFNPTDLDADQIVRAFKEAGMKGVILTAKHHDGFCLWPSAFTEHSVKNSPWLNGKGDMVRELSDACRRQDMKFGIYLSPWDRSHAEFGRPAYVTYYHNQLRELLTNYGPLFEVWFDGAAGPDGKGGDGWYGGAGGVRRMDPAAYYRWPEVFALIRELQPGAHIHSDIGPDSRWGGNESAEAGNPCWATVRSRELVFPALNQSLNLHGHRDGDVWMPSEMPHSIRSPSWFWREGGDAKVETPEILFRKYLTTAGRGAAFLLGLTPDTRGRIPDADVEALRGLRRIMDVTFRENLAAGATLRASNVRMGQERFSPRQCLDGDRATWWQTDDGVTTPALLLEFPKPVTFNLIRLREHLPLGQRIDAFALDLWKGGRWVEFTRETSVGNCRLIWVGDVTASKLRLRINQASSAPALSEFGLYRYQNPAANRATP